MRKFTGLMLLTVISLGTVPVAAQHGHPLVGSWSGDWGPSQSDRTRVLMTFSFGIDQVISGFIIENGSRIPLQKAELDPANWAVAISAERATDEGIVRYRIEGVIENLGSPTERTISGTWVEGQVSGDFRVSIN